MKTPNIFKKCQNNGLFRHLFVIIFTGNLHVEKESRNIFHSFSRNLDNFVAYSLSKNALHNKVKIVLKSH